MEKQLVKGMKAFAYTAIALIAILGLYAQTSIAEDSGKGRSWQTYEDAVYGYSIEYPAGWFVYPTPREGRGGVATIANYDMTSLPNQKTPDSSQTKIEIGVLLEDIPNERTLSGWLGVSVFQSVSVSDHDAIRMYQESIEGKCSESIYIRRGSKVYFINVVSSNNQQDTEAERMVSTFRFTKPYAEDQKAMGESSTLPEGFDVRNPSLAAPAGFRLPFVGRAIITNGPGEGWHRSGSPSAEAIDFAPRDWREVRATADGQVIYAKSGWNKGFGNLLLIRHGNYVSYYAHLAEFRTAEGNWVSKGQVVGIVGSTGRSTGIHLHFEVRSNVTSVPYSGNAVWIRDLPGISWNWENGHQCPPCNGYSGTATGEPVGNSLRNLARGKPTWTSSIENSNLTGDKAVDGSMSTRWSSRHGGSCEWIIVDLGRFEALDQVVLRWETAYASSYWIGWWDLDWWCWRWRYRTSSGGPNQISLPQVRACWVGVFENMRPGNWANISLWEFEIYDRPGVYTQSSESKKLEDIEPPAELIKKLEEALGSEAMAKLEELRRQK